MIGETIQHGKHILTLPVVLNQTDHKSFESPLRNSSKKLNNSRNRLPVISATPSPWDQTDCIAVGCRRGE